MSDISINIAPKIILSIASLYNDTNRILMEYIDNAIDNAENCFDRESNSYTKNIKISLTIDKEKIIIEDNCFGITDFNKVIQSIGWSDKKDDTWTNGQFGYGIYSFMAACSQLEITSKLENETKAKNIIIPRDKFDTKNQDDVTFSEPKQVDYSKKSGTTIVLFQFDKIKYKEINFDIIKQEIERHFELLLGRQNIEIKLINAVNRSKIEICQAFNYNDYNGETYEDAITTLSFTKGKKQPERIKLFVPNSPIKIFLKIIKNRVLDRAPIFVIKGRRVAEIKSINSFKSKHKSDIWGHPHITGYIDVSNFVEPTIARNEFRNNTHSKALFETLIELEPLILDVISDVNKANEDKKYKVLEDKFNQVLSKLAKQDDLNFRKSYIKNEKGGIELVEDEKGEDLFDINSGIVPPEPPEPDPDPNPIDAPINKVTKINSDSEFADDVIPGKETKKSGFNIKFVDNEPPINEEDQKPIRSQLIDGTIRIYKQHKDFEDRLDYSQTKEQKISQRLLTYLACEITVHYKDKIATLQEQPEYNKKLFEELVSFIYQFEFMIKDLAGQKVSELQ